MSSVALKPSEVRETPGGGRGQLALDAPLSVNVLDSLEAAEPVWRELESRAVLTPYQRYDWLYGWIAARGSTTRIAIVVIEAAGRPVALLPLEIGQRLGMRRATIIGTDIGNADWLVFDPEAAQLMTRDRLHDVLATAASLAGGIDLISLFDQPKSWGGMDNPLLAFPHQPGPNHFYLGWLENGSFDRFDEKRLGNLERRKRKLAELLGPVALRAAETVDEIDKVHETFLEQRAVRFAQMGIDNIFAQPYFVRFFRETAIASLGSLRPAMIFHALYAGETIVATACGTFCGTHYSQYINATAAGEAAKFRLVGILIHELFADCAARGATTVDMGLGDFDYKTDWTAPQEAYDGILPLSAIGKAGGAAILAARRLKRAVKQNDRLWAGAKKIRAMLKGSTVPRTE